MDDDSATLRRLLGQDDGAASATGTSEPADDAATLRRLLGQDDAPAAGASLPLAHAPDEGRPVEDYAEMPWADVAASGVKALPSSAGKALTGVAHAVTHPSETIGAIGDVGKGVYSKAVGALGFEQDPEEKAKTEALVNALGRHYAQTYGSMAGFKKSVAEDPFSVGMDLSVPLTIGAGAGAQAAGLTGKLARTAGMAATALDPVQGSLALAKTLAKAPAAAIKYGQSSATGISPALLDAARQAGETANPELRAAFLRHAKGEADAGEIANTAMNAVNELKSEASARYLGDKDALARSSVPLPMDKIDDAVDAFRKHVNHAGTATRFPGARDLLGRIEAQIAETHANPAARTMVGLDNLKQSLNDLYASSEARAGSAANYIPPIARAIKETIEAQDGTYAKMMEEWQEWRKQLLDYQKTLGANDKTAQSAQLAKIVKAAQGGRGESLMAKLAATQAGQALPYMIAGHVANPVIPEGLRRMLEFPTMLASAAMHWSAPLGVALTASPRVAGMGQYYAGRASGALNPVTKQPITYAASRLGEADAERPQRARGGRLTLDHAAHARRLIDLVSKTRDMQSSATKPLLTLPDDAIAKALAVANRSI